MDAYRITDADDRLNELVGRAEAGENVEIERDGRIVARLVAAGSDPVRSGADFDWNAYFEATKAWPFDPTNSVVEMRKDARY